MSPEPGSVDQLPMQTLPFLGIFRMFFCKVVICGVIIRGPSRFRRTKHHNQINALERFRVIPRHVRDLLILRQDLENMIVPTARKSIERT